jgi:hypothetical protein
VDDALLIKSTVASVAQKMRVGKFLCEFSIWELHNSLVKPVEEGGSLMQEIAKAELLIAI